MRFQQAVDVRPESGENFIGPAQVAQAEMNDFWRRFAKDDPIGKIRVFGDDDESVFARICPQRVILNAGAKG